MKEIDNSKKGKSKGRQRGQGKINNFSEKFQTCLMKSYQRELA